MCNSNATNTDKSINEQIKELFDEIFNDEFKKNNELEGQFIEYDGCVKEERYKEQNFKIAFLLKEVNAEDSKENCSLVEWLGSLKTKYEENSWENKNEENSWEKTWLNVCYWCEILKNLNANFTDAYNKEKKKLLENLYDIAIVNIKKTNGKGSSDYQDLEDAIRLYGDATIKEIEELIQPRLVICCSKDVYYLIQNKINVESKPLDCGTEYFVEKGIYYLKFVHPAWYSVNDNILFAYAKVAFGEIINVIKQNTCND